MIWALLFIFISLIIWRVAKRFKLKRIIKKEILCSNNRHEEGTPILTSVWKEWYCLNCNQRLRYEKRMD